MARTAPSRPRGPVASVVSHGYHRVVRALPISLRRRVHYARSFGRLPDLRRPQRFTEKVTWRILNDRRALLRDTCDKARMKAHAERTAPAGVRIPRTYWQGTDLAGLAAVDLPEHWVLKPNHRSGLVHFGSGRPDVAELAERTAGWLEPREWTERGEWAYSTAEPGFIVEERIGVPGTVLVDYKCYVFDGRVRAIQADADRFTSHTSRLYGPDWQVLGGYRDYPPGEGKPRPAHLDRMLAAAEAIGAGFDYMRVDLYEHEGTIWFGEITPYPGSGMVVLDSDALDLRIGRWWQLPPAGRTP